MPYSDILNTTHKTVGIDIAQDWIDIHIYPDNHERQYKNTPEQLIRQAKLKHDCNLYFIYKN